MTPINHLHSGHRLQPRESFCSTYEIPLDGEPIPTRREVTTGNT